MSRNCLRWHCNWPHLSDAGDDIIQAVQVPGDESYQKFRSLPLSEIIHVRKSALFRRPQDSMSSSDFGRARNCELSLEMLDTFKLRAISMICNVSKLEIFEGPLKSYRETIYGSEIVKSDSEEESTNEVEVEEEGEENEGRDEVDEQDAVIMNNQAIEANMDRNGCSSPATANNNNNSSSSNPSNTCYRYDIDASSIGVTALDIRFISNLLEICVFGMRIYHSQQHFSLSAHFPGTRSSNFSIDMFNVRKLLEDSFPKSPDQRSVKSEARLHQFLDAIEKSVEFPFNGGNRSQHVGENSKLNENHDHDHDHNHHDDDDAASIQSSIVNATSKKEHPIISLKPKRMTSNDHILEYLEHRLHQIESNLQQRLDEMEQRQATKLDKILQLLETKSAGDS